MDYLVTLLGSQTQNWKEVMKLISYKKWKKVFVVCNDFSYDKFANSNNLDNIEKVLVDFKKFDVAIGKLEKVFGDVKDMEVCLNIFSGVGEENFVVLQSLLRAGLSFSFVSMIGNEMKIWSIYEQSHLGLDVDENLDDGLVGDDDLND